MRDFPAELPKLLHVNKSACHRTICLSYLEGHYISKAAQQFYEYVTDYFRENNKG
jgi:hypothetical protein